MGEMLLVLVMIAAQEADGLIASPEAGWPQWRGSRRDGIATEKGLARTWPEGGPPLLWKVQDLGQGWSSPIIVGNRIYVTGDVGDDLVIYAFDLAGKPMWKTTNGRSWRKEFPGARACLAYAGGKLYHMNAHGRTVCLEPSTGKELWAVSVLEEFQGTNITWALSECLLVDGGRVIVTPGGRKALMAALDAKDGKTLWTTEPIEGDQATHSSPILLRQGGRRILIQCSSGHGFAAEAETGKRLWTVPLKNRYGTNVSTPAYGDGQVHFATAYFVGASYRLGKDGPESVWATPFDTCTGGWILADGVLYGGGYSKFKFWMGVDWKTGEKRCTLRELRSGAAVYADGRLFCLGEDGQASLVTPASEGFTVAGKFRFTPEKVDDAFAHPVVLDGRLYLRHHGVLACYSVVGSR